MSWLRMIFKELLGLFVEDGSFSIAILAWLWLLWGLLPRLPIPAAWHAVILFVGLAAVLFENAIRRAGRG
jgi:hypothetical protein